LFAPVSKGSHIFISALEKCKACANFQRKSQLFIRHIVMYFNAGYSYANLAEIDMSWLILTTGPGIEDLGIEEGTERVYNSRKRKIKTQGME
jgi:hypothetical protein